MKINRTPEAVFTHEGAYASHVSPIEELRRTVSACLLWEDSFYEDGVTVADRIKTLVAQCAPTDVAALAVEARSKHHLRHAPLFLLRELARHPTKGKRAAEFRLSCAIRDTIQRADELAEFLAIYWKDEKQPLSKQVKVGLSAAFQKFDEYRLAKYNRDGAVKLRDVLFMCHAKPRDDEQAALWKRLVDGTLAAPDTWEVALSGGADKRETFERLISEKKLGYLALLRNLRNMEQAGVPQPIVEAAILDGASTSRVLPFRFFAAARAVPAWERFIDQAMQAAMASLERLPGKTVVLVDVSGSMVHRLSAKSDLTRMDAACALAVLLRGVSDARVFAFSDRLAVIPARNGMALRDAIVGSMSHGGTRLGAAVGEVSRLTPDADRFVVFTDEQSCDSVGRPHCRGYMINVASYQNGVGYGDWTHINGFSESVVRYIQALEDTREPRQVGPGGTAKDRKTTGGEPTTMTSHTEGAEPGRDGPR